MWYNIILFNSLIFLSYVSIYKGKKRGSTMLGVLAEGMKKVGDWIEKTFGSPDIDEEIEKLFMENEEQEELKNVIMKTEENKKNEQIGEVEKYENRNDNPLHFGFVYGYLLKMPYWGPYWPYWFFFYDDD
jgi:hypothetical protein